jgi:cbb3-type cytochrome oxidase subunit 3
MDSGIIGAVWTLVSFITYIAISVWAYHPRRKEAFEAAARIPFDEDPGSGATGHPEAGDG